MSTITAQPLVLPSMGTLLSGLVWNTVPGTAQVVTYDFPAAYIPNLPSDEDVPVSGNPAISAGWAPLTAVQQALAQQDFASISAVCNLTFQAGSDSSAADILIATDTQTVTWGQ